MPSERSTKSAIVAPKVVDDRDPIEEGMECLRANLRDDRGGESDLYQRLKAAPAQKSAPVAVANGLSTFEGALHG